MSGATGAPADGHGKRDSRVLLDRLQTFSDGVFAIAMTLLVAQLTVPSIPAALPPGEIGHRLAAELAARGPQYYSFALSFLVAAMYWVAHHRKFTYLARHDAGLVWLNLLMLLCVVFIPFPTAVLGRYPEQTVAAVFYAVTLTVTGLVSASMTAYASWRGLHDPEVDPARIRYGIGRALVVPSVLLASIPVALVDPGIAELLWLLVFPLNRLLEVWRRRHGGIGA